MTRTVYWESDPAWAPSGRRIAYASDYPLCHGGECSLLEASIWVANADGTHRRRLTFSEESLRDSSPTWSRKGDLIAFASFDIQSNGSRHDGIWLLPANGGTPKRLVGIYAIGLEWSPRGKTIAFVGSGGLRLVDSATRRVMRLPTPGLPADQLDVAWSPSGASIAVAMTKGVFVVPARGGRARRVARAQNVDTVSGSPNGTTIAFSASPEGLPAAQRATFSWYQPVEERCGV